MALEITPQEFVSKWSRSELKEKSSAQPHFEDVCRLLGHGTPTELDPDGSWFTFEYGATKLSGDDGWADVWKKGFFGWEYKGKGRSLERAYSQILQYRESLQNPPLLIVSDIENIVIHTNFTNSVKREYVITLDDLLDPKKRDILWQAFNEPDLLRDPQTTEAVTKEAAERFGELAKIMTKWGEDPQDTAHFLIQILFCMFAEDIGILPRGIFTELLSKRIQVTSDLTTPMGKLFDAMSSGGWFGPEKISRFNGGLFKGEDVLEIPGDALEILRDVSELNWSNIEPAVFGTLFERSLDPSKRSQLGAHYTSREDIELVIDPVLMAPLKSEWKESKADVQELRDRAISASTETERAEFKSAAILKLYECMARLRGIHVLDPACGSGNFLYVSLTSLLELQKEMIGELKTLGISGTFPSVDPEQLHGIEINTYAHELAETTIWIGYIQWLYQNGYGFPEEPILKPIDSILNMDAILDRVHGKSKEPKWPASFAIVGNPPYLGDKKMIRELGEDYVRDLRDLYKGRIPAQSDLVCYWFERARTEIENGRAQRAGLLATQGIRGGANRRVLERIKESGDIFWAESNRDWVLDGANVNVSMIGFDSGEQENRVLDGENVDDINPDLTSGVDLGQAEPLAENRSIAYQGPVKVGPFDIDEDIAKEMLSKQNPNGRPNSDVIKKWAGAFDITRTPRHKWIIDFGEMERIEAAGYEAPFEYVREHVKPIRENNRDKSRREYWWRLGRSGSDFKAATSRLDRFILTPRVSKHRIFVWVDGNVLPASSAVAISRDDEYSIGVLSSRIHVLWALGQGTHLEDRPRYTPSTTFETFPFPWPLGEEPIGDQRLQAIAQAAGALVSQREKWLHDDTGHRIEGRSLGGLYSDWPTWLELAHDSLDDAVFSAYEWDTNSDDRVILKRLMKINLSRHE